LQPSPGLFVFDPVIEFLFNDAEPLQAEEFAKGHTPHSANVFRTPVVAPLWTEPALNGHRVAIRTMLDTLFPPAAQDAFIESSGVDWRVVEVDGGHEAFLTKPAGVANIITDAVRRWTS